MTNCPKCEAIKDYINAQRDEPPAMSFEVEEPFRKALRDIENIITYKSFIEQEKEKIVALIESRKKYQKIKHSQTKSVARRFREKNERTTGKTGTTNPRLK